MSAEAPCGVLLIDKPSGPTSHDVVGWVRWALRERRVGHCGTLDPAATGLLAVCVGAATRLSEAWSAEDKTYRARFLLGRSTNTADLDGETIALQPCTAADGARALECLEALVGPLMLPPPRFSAVHVDGRRAHELARAGEDFTMAPRPMVVHRVEDAVVEHGPEIAVCATLSVSKGTYIRSLAEALGEALGLPVCLAALHRVRSGAWDLEDPRAVSRVQATSLPSTRGGKPRTRLRCAEAGADRDAQGARLRASLISPIEGLPFPTLRLAATAEGARAMGRLAQGQVVSASDEIFEAAASGTGAGLCAVVGPEGRGLIVAERTPATDGHPACLQPRRLIIAPAPGVGTTLDNRVTDEDSPPDNDLKR